MRKMMETNGATSNLRQVLDHLRAALPLHGDARQRYLNELAVSDADLAGEVDRRLRRYRQHQQLARLGEYELFEVIGRGGVGVVYRARQIGSSRELAIKVLPGFGSSLSDHKRVLQAYESVSRLSHPSIVPVLSVTTGRDGQIMLVMPCVNGTDLGKLIKQGPLDARQSAEWASSIARALEYTHGQGVIHQDVKPENILIDENNQALLCDFDLARLLDATAQLTHTGEILGTLAYMSPEQARGADVDERSDVYAVGAVLYAMLTGRAPFESRSRAAVLDDVCHRDPIPPRQLVGDVPRALETVCLKCLEKSQHKRYASAAELAGDVDRWLRGESVHARPPGWPDCLARTIRKHRAATLLAVAIVVVAASALVAISARRERLLAENRARTADLQSQLEAQKRQAADERSAWSEFAASLEAARIECTSPQPGWTVRGLAHLKRACRLRQDDARLVDLRSVLARCQAGVDLLPKWEFAPNEESFCIEYSPEGCHLAIGQNYGIDEAAIEIRDADSGAEVRAYRLRAKNFGDNVGVRALVFSPDGTWLAAGLRDNSIRVWNTQSDESHAWIAHEKHLRDLEFSPEGRMLASCAEDHKCHLWSTGTWDRIGGVEEDSQCGVVKFSRDGAQLIVSTRERLSTYDVAGLRSNQFQPVGERIGWDSAVAFSPRGEVLAAANAHLISLRSVPDQDRGVVACVDPTTLDQSHDRGIERLDFSADGTLLASGSGDQSVKLWESASGRLLSTLRGENTGYVWPAFRPGGCEVAVLLDRKVVVYQVTGGEVLSRFGLHSQPIRAMSTGPNRGEVVCVAYAYNTTTTVGAGNVTRWDTRSGNRIAAEAIPPNVDGEHQSAAIAFAPASPMFCCAIRGRPFLVSGTETMPLPMWSPFHISLAFHPLDSTLWAAVDKQLYAVDTTTGNTVGSWRNWLSEAQLGHSSLTAVVALGDAVAVASRDGSVKLFSDPPQLHPVETWQLGSPVYSLASTKDQRTLIAGTLDGRVALYDLASGDELESTIAHSSQVSAVDFAINVGGVFATGANDGSLSLWRYRHGALEKLMTLSEASSERPVRALKFVDGGNRLIVLRQNDLALRAWRIDRLRDECRALGIDW